MELLLIPILLIGFFMRIPYCDFPIDADFGLYTYLPYFRKRGIKFIKDFWGFYSPVIYIYLIIERFFGEDIKSIRHFSNFYNVFTTLATFMVTNYLFGTPTAITAALIYALFSASPYIGGYSCHTEEIYVLPVTLGVLTLAYGLSDSQPTYLLYTGVFIAISFLLKVVNIIYFVTFILYILTWHSQGDALYFFSAFLFTIVTYALLITWFYRGENRQLWWQNNTRIKTAIDYIENSLSALWDRFKLDFIPIWRDTWSIIILSAISFYFLIPQLFNSLTHQLLIIWLLSSFFVFISQRVFRMYQYIPLIQIASILSAVAIYKIFEFGMMPLISGVIFILAVNIYRKLRLLYLYKKDKRLLSLQKSDQLFYIPEIARYIKERTAPDDYIYEWGPYAHLYRLADRPSCEGFLFHFVKPYSQWHTYLFDEILKGIILKKPVYIVLVRTDFNIDILRQITGLDYDMERLFFNRYRVYRLKGKVSEPLNIDDMHWKEKIRWLELLTHGSSDYDKIDGFYVKRGMYEEAMNEYRDALKLNPTDLLMKHGMEVLKIITQYNLYSASAENGGREYAKEGFHNILKNEDAPIELKAGCCFHLGKIYMNDNRLNDATDYFKRCLMFLPQHKKAAEYLNQLRVVN